jgi:hypothetical protein
MTHDGDPDALAGDGGRRIWLRVIEAIRLVLAEELWPHVPVAQYELDLVAGTRRSGPAAGLETQGCGG